MALALLDQLPCSHSQQLPAGLWYGSCTGVFLLLKPVLVAQRALRDRQPGSTAAQAAMREDS
jgi:hypothetical protein